MQDHPIRKTPRPKIQVACGVCGTLFFTFPSRIDVGKGRFCSHACGRQYCSENIARRFWGKVDKTDGCWLWTGDIDKAGYGQISTKQHRHSRASRVSWEIHIGPIPDGLFVCHNCPGGDNPRCVNPAHLFLGTHEENMADMVRKGRHAHGERKPGAKLTDVLVAEGRRLHAAGADIHDIAAQCGVVWATMYKAIHRLTWKHVP